MAAWPQMAESRTPADSRPIADREQTGPGSGQELPPLEALYAAHAHDVFRLVSRILGPGAAQADVDDLVQEAFMTVDRLRGQYRGEGSPYAFVYGVTTRRVLRHLRGRRRYTAMLGRFEKAHPEAALPPNPEETAEHRQAVSRLGRALEKVKPERRVVLILHRLEGLSAPEIGRLLNLSEEAVRSRLRRARSDLAHFFELSQKGEIS